MKALVRLATLAAVATALAVPASAQIISTSLPSAKAGAARDKFSMHIMATPFAVWDYKEIYYGSFSKFDETQAGLIKGNPNSDFMAAADLAFALGESNWSVTAGGWYNKVGNKTYDFDGYLFDAFDIATLQGQVPVDLQIYEGHLGLFYKSVGVQGGLVHTDQKSNGDWTYVVRDGVPIGDFPAYGPFDAKTDDWTVFGVYRHSTERLGVSVGAGAYFKQGIEEDSPLRSTDGKTVFSGFVTANVNVFKGLGLDFSYWYIGKTNLDFAGDEFATELLNSLSGSDAQSRFTIGIGYSF